MKRPTGMRVENGGQINETEGYEISGGDSLRYGNK